MTKEAPKQKQGEPVGWIDSKGNMICTKINESCKPLYTTPQTKEWVGLTRTELIQCGVLPFGMSYELCQEIEAKLKQKNT